MKKNLLAGLAAFVLSNALTTAWYMAMSDQNAVEFRREEFNYAALMVNHLLFAGLFVYFFPFYYKPAPKIGRAMLYGVLMAALMYLPQALVIRAIWEVEIDLMFAANSSAHLAIGGVMGLAVGLIWGKGQQVSG